jgi:very-short-patch-repair endonuclease
MGSDPLLLAVRDEHRTRALEDAGFKVIRLWNNQILNEFEFVKEAIWQALEDNPPPSRPSP